MRNITATNTKRIKEVLEKIEAKASVRCLSYLEINSAIAKFEKRLKLLGIPKKYWVGCKIIISHTVSYSYKYYAEGTVIKIEKINCGWTVTSIKRAGVPKGKYDKIQYLCILTEAAKTEIPNTITF